MSRVYPAATECYSVVRWSVSVGSWYGGKSTVTYANILLSILSLLHPLHSHRLVATCCEPKGQGSGSRRGQGARGASVVCHTCGVHLCGAVGINVLRCTMHSNKLSSTIASFYSSGKEWFDQMREGISDPV